MSGITRIQQGREESRRPDVTFTPGKEIWFRDGDQVFLSRFVRPDTQGARRHC